MTKTIVLDRRTSKNSSLDYGDFVTCCNCGKTMLADIRIDKCPECDEETLAWADEKNQEVSDDFFYNNEEYMLVNMEEYYIDEKSIRYYYPFETDKKVVDYGVLAEYIGKKFSRKEMDKIIAEMILRHPYIDNSKRLSLAVMRNQSYYHILEFRNYNYNKQEKGNESIKYETECIENN